MALAALAGCGGEGRPTVAPAETATRVVSGYFVGRSQDGLGASVDFRGYDAVKRALEAAIGRRAPAPRVAVASLVNTSGQPLPVPTFVARLADGGETVVMPARRYLANRSGPGARLVLARLPLATLVAPRAGLTTYLVLPEAPVSQVVEIRMRVGAASASDLRAVGR